MKLKRKYLTINIHTIDPEPFKDTILPNTTAVGELKQGSNSSKTFLVPGVPG
jgi:hypothetical protein